MKYFGTLLTAALFSLYYASLITEASPLNDLSSSVMEGNELHFEPVPLEEPLNWIAGRGLQGFDLLIIDLPVDMYTQQQWENELKWQCKEGSWGRCKSLLIYVATDRYRKRVRVGLTFSKPISQSDLVRGPSGPTGVENSTAFNLVEQARFEPVVPKMRLM
ncbi:hypothetical protein AJ78_08846 [Emergomyces pasteurianus Ep9510]|uniref:Uncharacterized protein n=1 Tax=Emergomyces pasteurianus Ep9510 TaxID=1447872 RepID=A0A1J9Q440_9EURO|nr:hypothetical protein AJ78_08846 [Emergomyces pasteurianus Ep9510]